MSHLALNGLQEHVGSELINTCLSSSITASNIRSYWLHKSFFNDISKSTIDWTVSQQSSRLLPSNMQLWLSKWNTGMCGVGKWLGRWKWQDHADCPHCGQLDEDVQHVLLCNEIPAITLWEDSLLNLEQWFDQNDGDPEKKLMICQSLQSWHNRSPLIPIQTDNTDLSLAIQQQDNLSWYSFLCGFLASGWRQVQHNYLLHIGSKKSSMLWLTKLQHQIWEIPWSTWEHSRNKHLHNDGSSIHLTDYQSIVGEIIREWNLGANRLSQQHQHLFNGNIHQQYSMRIYI